MGETVYIDVVLLENFLLNYLLLYIINRYLKSKAKQWRIVLSAALGALYVLVIYFPNLSTLYSLGMKFIISILMIIIAFSPYKLKEFIKTITIFYLEAFILGGTIFGLFYFINGNSASYNSILLIDNITPMYIITGTLIAIILVKIGFDFYEHYYFMEKNKVELKILINNKSCELTALIDTGNSLKDPLSNIPVIIVYYKAVINSILSSQEDSIREDIKYEIFIEELVNSNLKSRIRLIPYKAIGTENGLLTGIRTDFVMVKTKNNTNLIQNAIIALYENKVSTNNEYQALAYPGICNNG